MYRPLFLVFTATIWATAGAFTAEVPSDYLSDELRARVETLKINASTPRRISSTSKRGDERDGSG